MLKLIDNLSIVLPSKPIGYKIPGFAYFVILQCDTKAMELSLSTKAKAMTLFTYPQARKFMKVRLVFIQNNRSNAESAKRQVRVTCYFGYKSLLN